MPPHDVPQDRVDVTPRRNQGAHPKVVVHENVVRRSVNLETGEEEIEVLDVGELAVERFSRSPARPVWQCNLQLSRRTRGAEFHEAPKAPEDSSLVPSVRTVDPARFPPSPRPGRKGRRFSARPCVIPKSTWQKCRDVPPPQTDR